MKNKWQSYIYIPIMACLLALSGVYIWDTKSDSRIENPEQIYYLDEYFEADDQKPTEAHAVDEKNVVLEQTPKARFVLRAVDNFVYVYEADKPEETYMSTGICMDELPEITKKEIIDGKEIKDEEALYFFLESHSS